MNIRMTRFFVAPAAIAAAGLFVASAAAQTESTQPPPMQQQQQQPQSFSDDQLKSYAVAALEVNAIHQDYRDKIASAQQSEPEKAQALHNEAQEKMVQVVQSKGLTVETYNNISLTARAEPELRKKIVQFMEEAR